ncbi:hypothetical protein L1O48_07615 [Ligilactobacillus equi]|uniref:hypothetical protein n=1 Tax=Ligilactobacillus equi TaxID=137357 RepID=UPI002ED69756
MKDIKSLLSLSPEKIIAASVLDGVGDLKKAITSGQKSKIADEIEKQRELLGAIKLLNK